MSEEWKALKEKIDAENARIIEESPEDVLRVFKYEILRSGAGTGGLMLAPWFEGATAGRYVGAYYVYNIIKLASLPDYSLDDVKTMVALMLPKVVSTARLCGLETLASFSSETLKILPEIQDMETAVALLNSLYLYGSNMNAWIHHYMKWGIGYAFPIPTKESLLDMAGRAGESYR